MRESCSQKLPMNVIPFRPRPEQEPLAFAIGARVDLRVGALAAGVVRPRGEPREAFAFSTLARMLRGARMAWLERGLHAPLTLAVSGDVHADLEADALSEAAIEAGCTRRGLSFELCERRIVSDGPALAEELRARGWNVALRADPDCPLPFGARARALYAELVIEAPADTDPFLAMPDGDRSPLGRRLLAAKGAGLIITAESVRSTAHARTLAIAGFDRGGGRFAEAGLR
ncbi:MAG: hypothetical protein DCF16_10190 [Alphaproteobacteria bacterium]|nr:MAG: hypothetical protein DCF16_10190 [Alphaproteobacteria bacterium]